MSDQFKQKVVAMAKGGQRQEALHYARQYIQQHPDDIDAWWFVANLVKDPKVQRQCCEHILEVNPFHSEAQIMLDELNAVAEPQLKIAPFIVEADPSPFVQDSAPQSQLYTDPLGMRVASQAVEPSIGLPSLSEFFDESPTNSQANLDLRPLGMKMQADIAKPNRPAPTTPVLDDKTAYALVAGIAVVAVLIIIAVIYFSL